MSDSLDRIEADLDKLQRLIDAKPTSPAKTRWEANGALSRIKAERDALVEVAKAAQEAKKLLGTGYHNDTFDDQAYRVLAAALARLEDNQ